MVHSGQGDDSLITAYVQATLAMEPSPVQHLQEAAHTSDRHAATQQALLPGQVMTVVSDVLLLQIKYCAICGTYASWD